MANKLKATISKYVTPKLSKLPSMPKASKVSISAVKIPKGKTVKKTDFAKLTKLNKPLKVKKLALLKSKIKKNAGF